MKRCLAKNSVKPMMNMTEVSFTLIMKLLPICGMMLRMACGSMTLVMVWKWFMPMLFAPSVWPGSMEIMPPRTLSAMYAPVLMDTMMMAASQRPDVPRNCISPPVK